MGVSTTMNWRQIMRGTTGAIVVAASIAAALSPAQAGTWVVDPRANCQVWNPNPQLEEMVSWSGSCLNGRAEGHGIAQWFKEGRLNETDEGDWREGRQVKGTQSWATGRYEGDLVDGEPSGHGILTVQKLRYEGAFRNGRPNGTGSLAAGGETVRGTWKDGCLQGSRKASIGVPLATCR